MAILFSGEADFADSVDGEEEVAKVTEGEEDEEDTDDDEGDSEGGEEGSVGDDIFSSEGEGDNPRVRGNSAEENRLEDKEEIALGASSTEEDNPRGDVRGVEDDGAVEDSSFEDSEGTVRDWTSDNPVEVEEAGDNPEVEKEEEEEGREGTKPMEEEELPFE